MIDLRTDKLLSLFSMKIDLIVRGVINPVVNLLSTLIMIFFILVILFVINFKTSFFIFCSLALFYIFTSFFVKAIKVKNSVLISHSSNEIIRNISDFFSNIKYSITANIGNFYLNNMKLNSKSIFNSFSNNAFIGLFPKTAIESCVLLAIILIAYQNFSNYESLKIQLPYFILLAVSAQKLIPLMQSVYFSISSIYGNFKSCSEVIDFLSIQNKKNLKDNNNIIFNKSINFNNISFSYETSIPVIKNLTFEIKKNEIIGIHGESGSGKTTLSTILLGLLKPSKGFISVDGVKINSKNYISFTNMFSIVPQDVFLVAGSVIDNITLGQNKDDIDYDKVIRSAKIACIDKFIDKLPNKYNYNIHEKGSKFSGGQKQRLALARAIYLDKDIYIFDEATSALDKPTERKVIKSIFSLNKTIIIISHNTSLIDLCDRVINLGKYNVQ